MIMKTMMVVVEMMIKSRITHMMLAQHSGDIGRACGAVSIWAQRSGDIGRACRILSIWAQRSGDIGRACRILSIWAEPVNVFACHVWFSILISFCLSFSKWFPLCGLFSVSVSLTDQALEC
uniref:Uncharacterized protein n=1 Tax=Anguilla anguilla TaxID=7936 RepID=A0A0E9WNA2_ANGAN